MNESKGADQKAGKDDGARDPELLDHERLDPGRTGDFLGLPLWGGTVEDFLSVIGNSVADELPPARIAYLNAHTTNLAFGEARHRAALKRANLLYADGMAVVWGARRRGVPVAERINAGDFLPEFAERAVSKGWRVAYVGGDSDWPPRVIERLQEHAPGFDLVFHHHGYFSAGAEEEEAVKESLAAAKPDICLLGMGSSRQEEVMARWGADPALSSISFWCVGALFEYYAGVRRRAPLWMRRLGLEWAVRLVLEPRRLWQRYLIGNTLFVFRAWRGRPVSPP